MSVMFMSEEEAVKYNRENAMYHRIMRDGKLDENGYLIAPPDVMTEEESAYYRKLLKERNGKIQYTV